MNELKAAVIGMGKMGMLHAAILNSIDNVKVTAVADTEKFALKFIERIQICNGKRGSRNLDVKMAYYNMLNFLPIIVSLIIPFNGY